MCAKTKAFLRAAADYLASLGIVGSPFAAVAVDHNGVEHLVRGHEWPGPEAPAAERPQTSHKPGRDFSDREIGMLKGLYQSGWMTARELADAIPDDCDNDFRAILSNLAKREYTTTNQRYGNRLTEAGEEYVRAHLLAP